LLAVAIIQTTAGNQGKLSGGIKVQAFGTPTKLISDRAAEEVEKNEGAVRDL